MAAADVGPGQRLRDPGFSAQRKAQGDAESMDGGSLIVRRRTPCM